MNNIQTMITTPRVLRSYQPLLLLSHMRANTSVLSHILGNNPGIEGYYELHIGYHSCRSFIRQKLIYFQNHKPKRTASLFYDKVLHDGHFVNMSLLKNGKIIFALREPEQTVRSIVNLYRETDSGDRLAEIDGAIEYYVNRLKTLARMRDKAPVPFCYLDADALKTNTETTLDTLTNYLELPSPLSSEYETRPLTGTKLAGDSSSAITGGRILTRQSDYSDIELPGPQMSTARSTFKKVRDGFLEHPLAEYRVTEEALQ